MPTEPETPVIETPTETVEETATNTPATIDPAEYARMQVALKAANKEAAERRKKLETYEQAETAKKEAEMTAAQKAEARAIEADARALAAESKLQAALIKGEFNTEANKAQFGDDGKKKFIDPEAAFKLAELTAVTVEDGKVSGVADALRTLAKQYPWMLENSTTTQAGPTSPVKGKLPTTQAPEKSNYPRASY